ncbi:coproporphyrinogen III oxidase, anaerobic [[Leptolyngbya] sp. PCC 7376]|uniref:radical SAM family heme chaperone HemW n=1 Tax=[Leptolyngbya] sp. PCC 7376 TaxID=111781 RepID=UPI00029EE662|nr:radical SAM family heme chaperone HemW [[Leptolyngbya] sp. PCC 7376]AFY37661.1 coproporphyrinogen III oxidase, anaerobic [[Leptolyngbya] sp. PCC 7376]
MNEFTQTPVTSAYIHLPFCIQRCFYCDFPISVVGDRRSDGIRARMEEYVMLLCREITATPILGGELNTVFFGGGTPSLLPIDLLEEILCVINKKFGMCTDVEISLEIDPGTFSLEQLIWYKDIGVNRVSLGVQAFQDCLLKNSGRSHTVIDIVSACDHIRQSAIAWSLDLISGLPDQTLENWQDSLQQAIAFNPHHISSYDLVVEPQTPFGKQYEPGEKPLPSDQHTADMYRIASQTLRDTGYDHYEVSNYAKPGYQCRHNRVYWENRPYYAFGMGAASFTNSQRFSRPRTRREYYEWVEQYEQLQGQLNVEKLTQGDHLLETLMLGLRLTEGIPLSHLIAEFGQTTVNQIMDILKPSIAKNWVTVKTNAAGDRQNIALTDPEGLLFSNTILSGLFQHLDADL